MLSCAPKFSFWYRSMDVSNKWLDGVWDGDSWDLSQQFQTSSQQNPNRRCSIKLPKNNLPLMKMTVFKLYCHSAWIYESSWHLSNSRPAYYLHALFLVQVHVFGASGCFTRVCWSPICPSSPNTCPITSHHHHHQTERCVGGSWPGGSLPFVSPVSPWHQCGNHQPGQTFSIRSPVGVVKKALSTYHCKLTTKCYFSCLSIQKELKIWSNFHRQL